MKKHVFTLLALTIAGSAMAQTPPAVVPNIASNITGVATAIDASGNVLQSLRNGDVIPVGSRVSTTGSITLTSTAPGGSACTTTLASGQSMLMSATSVCDAFTAQAQAPRTLASGGGFGGGLLTPLNVGIGVASLATLRVVTQGTTPAAPISRN